MIPLYLVRNNSERHDAKSTDKSNDIKTNGANNEGIIMPISNVIFFYFDPF